jgi:glutathionylspermidine synthase
MSGAYVRKPMFSREGANITIRKGNEVVSSGGEYGEEGWVYQAYAPLPRFGAAYPVIGSWVIGDMSAGIGIREDDSEITKNTSRFVPHYFLP